MPRIDRDDQDDSVAFPILRGESVGESGEFSGYVAIIRDASHLSRKLTGNHVAVLHHLLEPHFAKNPDDLDELMKKVSAVISEFGDAVSDFAAAAYHRETIAVVKVVDACHVLEENMHIRIIAHENNGDIFFID